MTSATLDTWYRSGISRLTANVNNSIWISAATTLAVAIVIGLICLDPLWSHYSPPFPMPRVTPAIFAPVDGPFYLQNAERGYCWTASSCKGSWSFPISLWFHPLLPAIVWLLAHVIPGKWAFWLISLAFSFVAIVLTDRLIRFLFPDRPSSAWTIFLLILVPGGLSLATGNAETPELALSTALLLSVLAWRNPFLPGLLGFAAILTKPNALYMVLVLAAYVVWAIQKEDRALLVRALMGIGGVVIGLLLWMGYVGQYSGDFGTYWQAREAYNRVGSGNAVQMFQDLVRVFRYEYTLRDAIRFTSGLLVPLIDLWLLALLRFPRERDRLALSMGVIAMLGTEVLTGTPNKLIVYNFSTPAGVVPSVLGLEMIVRRGTRRDWKWSLVAGSYLIYCAAMLVVYVVGTGLGWYY